MANIINQYGQVKLGVRSTSAPLTLSYLLDTYSGAAAAYSLRKLRAAYTGAAIRVRRSSDNTTLDVGFNADGTLDTASMLSFVGAGNGYVSIWYDQSGNGNNATQTSSSAQPQIILSGVLQTLNGKPIIKTNTTTSTIYFNTPISNIVNRPLSIITTGKIYQLPTNAYSNTTLYVGATADNYTWRYNLNATSTNFANGIGGSTTNQNVAAYSTNPFINQAHFGTTTLTNRFNGTDSSMTINDAGQNSSPANFLLMNIPNPFIQITSNMGMFECIFYLNDKTSDRTGIESNINSHYSIYATDVDAQAFITAAVITDQTQQSAINTLVTNLKTAGIWTKMKAIYPFVGGAAAQHRFNLKSPGTTNADFYLDFLGGGTHSATGYQPNGNSYANTKLTPSTSLLQDSTHISYYSRTNTTNNGIDFGVYQTTPQANLYAAIKLTDGKSYFRVNRNAGVAESSLLMTSASVFFMLNRIASNSESVFVNNTKTAFGRVSTGLSTNAIPLGALSDNGAYVSYSNKECAFASIGDGLTDAEATAFYTAVQKYQTTLGRQV